MPVIEDRHSNVFEALLNPAQIGNVDRIPGSMEYFHVRNYDAIPERRELLRLHNFILSKDFIAYQEEKLKLMLGIFIFRNPFDNDERPFYLLGDKNAFHETEEKPSFILQPHYYLQQNGHQVYSPEPLSFIDEFLRVNLNDRQSYPATDQDFFIHTQHSSRLSRFERENDLYYVPSGEFDFCLLQWLVLLIRQEHQDYTVSVNKTYDLVALLKDEFPEELNIGHFFTAGATTLAIWLERFGITDDNGLTERGEAMFYWITNLLAENSDQQLFTVDTELKKHYLKNELLKGIHTIDDLVFLLDNYGRSERHISELIELFTKDCRFRLPIHFIMRYSPREGRVESACRGLFAINAFKQRIFNDKNRIYDNVGFYLGLFRDATVDGRNYATMSECPEAYAEFKRLLYDYKLLVKVLGEVEFREIYHKNVLLKQLNDLSKEARQTAVASVMARCLSHYNGSHILPDVRNYFKKLGHYYNDFSKRWIVQYLDFLQNRMELIADITAPENTRSAFSFNLNEDIVRPLQGYLHGPGLGLFDAFHNKDNSGVKININYGARDDKPQKTALIRGGQLGISAFYLILENILRNYYKHANKVPSKRYSFHLAVSEPEEEALKKKYWCIDVFDLHGGLNENKRKALSAKGGYALIERLQDYIDQPVIDKMGKLRPDGLGFIEMKAAACYLINYPLSLIDRVPSTQSQLKLLEAGYYQIDSKTQKMVRRYSHPTKTPENPQYHLGFRFYIKKVKNLLIDESAILKSAGQNRKSLTTRFWGFDTADFKKFNKEQRTDHEIVVTNKNLPTTNQRVVNTMIDQHSNPEKLEEKCWQIYTDKLTEAPLNPILYRPFEQVLAAGHVNVAVDNHGSSFKNCGLNEIKRAGFDAYFVQSSDMPTFPKEVLVCHNTSEKEEEVICRLPYRLKETALITLTIFDERIQNDVGKIWENQPNLTLRDIHELGGVFIPVKPLWTKQNFEMDPIDLDNIDHRNRDRFRSLFEKRLVTDHYVIIHYTLFEKIIPDKMNFETYAIHLTTLYPNKLVFCSGSVRKSLQAKDHLFMNLSTLQNVLINRPSKYELVNILKSL